MLQLEEIYRTHFLDYINFVDSDDYIEANMYEILVKNIKDNNADIAMCGYKKYFQNYNIFENYSMKKQVIEGRFEINKIFTMNLSNGNLNFHITCNKLYKKSIIADIKFSEINVGEDLYFNCNIFPKCTKLVINNLNMYVYRIHDKSTIHGNFNSARLENMYSAILSYEIYESNEKLKSFSKYLLAVIEYKCLYDLNVVKECNLEKNKKKQCIKIIYDIFNKYCAQKSYLTEVYKIFETNNNLLI